MRQTFEKPQKSGSEVFECMYVLSSHDTTTWSFRQKFIQVDVIQSVQWLKTKFHDDGRDILLNILRIIQLLRAFTSIYQLVRAVGSHSYTFTPQ